MWENEGRCKKIGFQGVSGQRPEQWDGSGPFALLSMCVRPRNFPSAGEANRQRNRSRKIPLEGLDERGEVTI